MEAVTRELYHQATNSHISNDKVHSTLYKTYTYHKYHRNNRVYPHSPNHYEYHVIIIKYPQIYIALLRGR